MKTVRKDTGNRKVFVLLAIQGRQSFLRSFLFCGWETGSTWAETQRWRRWPFFCIVWCIWNELLERRLWNEQMFYENTVKRCKTGGAVTIYLCLVWFFTAQISVFLRLSLAAVLDIWS